ncbi:phage portal protein [Oceanospirillum sediminis]|uniref:Phage portal protein n=1 Tax=Oceanospirillum sediminis TaxID=2760088 RepID=A0A839IY84_9GAMM|nr:phage portal protein [Oceanospirillum sediminis]MBB1489399.1 phage portal protein [Oceanospirillum sediminis]
MQTATPAPAILDAAGQPMRPTMNYQGAGAGFGGQLSHWQPGLKTVDAALLPSLNLGNARAEDVVRNNAFASNGVQLHVDNIVGDLFRLCYKPDYKVLGISQEEAAAFAREVEAAWHEIAEDPTGCYLDAERKRTFTMMIREGVAVHTRVGEDMFAAEWIDRPGSLIKTAIKSITPKRVCNPDGKADTRSLKAGVAINRHGAAVGYHVRSPGDLDFGLGNGLGSTWQYVSRETRHRRPKFVHIFEPTEDGQTRGANQFLTVLEQMQILPKMQHTKLQNFIVNAMYAATIESEMPPDMVMGLMGGQVEGEQLLNYMGVVNDYHKELDITMNGVRVPHLIGGERLNLQTSGNADNGYVDLEGSVLRWLAAGLNLPYETLAKDFKQISYSAARASLGENWRYFMGRRKIIAARKATIIFRLVLEELLFRNLVSMPKGVTRDFYQATNAWTRCRWIGSGRLAIDGLKETKEAIMRIEAGLSTYEDEMALMGKDYLEVFDQQQREAEELEARQLPASLMRLNAMRVLGVAAEEDDSGEES